MNDETWPGQPRGPAQTPSRRFDADHLAAQPGIPRAMHLNGASASVLVGHSSCAALADMAALKDRNTAAGIMFLDGDAVPLIFPPLVTWLKLVVLHRQAARPAIDDLQQAGHARLDEWSSSDDIDRTALP
jgi:hypothetical protein